jgi:hypothetical protein
MDGVPLDFAMAVLAHLDNQCAAWFPEWARRHCIRFAFRRPEDPEWIADFWPTFREAGVSREEAEEASRWLTCKERRPRGRPEHLPYLLGRIKQRRREAQAKRPTGSTNGELNGHRLSDAEWNAAMDEWGKVLHYTRRRP